MSWNARMSMLVLVVMTGLPVSGTVCAYFCHSAPQRADRAAAHHGDAACAQSSDDGASQIRGLSGHDCRSHTLTAQSPATPERVVSSFSSTAMLAAIDHAIGTRTIAGRPPLGRDAPRGTPPLTATPPVLRI